MTQNEKIKNLLPPRNISWTSPWFLLLEDTWCERLASFNKQNEKLEQKVGMMGWIRKNGAKVGSRYDLLANLFAVPQSLKVINSVRKSGYQVSFALDVKTLIDDDTLRASSFESKRQLTNDLGDYRPIRYLFAGWDLYSSSEIAA